MISANGGLPAHRYTPQVTPRWPRGSEPASKNKDKNGSNPNPNPGGKFRALWRAVWSYHTLTNAGPARTRSTCEHEGGDDGNAKKRSCFMRMARKLRNKGFEVTGPAEF